MEANFINKLHAERVERICAWHMDGEVVQKPVHTLLHGFRTDRNTNTALSSVANQLEKGTYMDKETIAVFLDIAAAFDTVTENVYGIPDRSAPSKLNLAVYNLA